MKQVPEFEQMLTHDGMHVIKLWLSITKDEQERRLKAVKNDPLASWKLSGLDKKALKLWDHYSRYKRKMIKKTSLPFSPWVNINADYAPAARVEAIKYVLSQVPYPKSDSTKDLLTSDPKIITSLL